jgi:hypothetical protein
VRRLALAALLLVAGCRARTEIVLGVITDFEAPAPLGWVRLVVHAPGDEDPNHELLHQEWLIPGNGGQEFVLPGSFGIYTSDGSEPRVQAVVTAWDGPPGDSGSHLLVRRQSILKLIGGSTLFMRMSLVRKCQNRDDCESSSGNMLTCVEGTCKPLEVDTRRLPAYVDTLVSSVDCESGTSFIDTGKHTAIAAQGTCTNGSFCQEGTCYSVLPSDGPDAGTTPNGWQRVASLPTTSDLHAVTGAPNPAGGYDLYAVGDKGAVLHLGGGAPTSATGWVADQAPGDANLRAVWVSPALAWAVGDAGALLTRSAPSVWSAVSPSVTSDDLRGVWASGPSDVWVVGGNTSGELFYFDGQTWSKEGTLPAVAPLAAVSGTGPDDVWLVGASGSVVHWAGTTLRWQTPTAPITAESFTSVWAFPGGVAFAGAQSGAIYRLSAPSGGETGAVTVEAVPDLGNPLALGAVFGFSPSDLYAVGAAGLILHGTPDFTGEDSGASDDLFGVWGATPGDVYAVGRHGTVLRSPESAPVPVDGGVDLSLTDLSLTDLSLADLSQPDLSQPDLSQPDLSFANDLLPTDDGGGGDGGPPQACQQFNVYTVAGNGNATATDGTSGATGTGSLVSPSAIAFDPSPTLIFYIADPGSAMRSFDPGSGMIGTVIPGTVPSPGGLAVDPLGAMANGIYMSSTSTHQILRVPLSDGYVVIAGTGQPGYVDSGGGSDGGLSPAQFNTPSGIAIDAKSKIYIADSGNHRIRTLDTTTGIVATLAGNGSPALANGPGPQASFNTPTAVALDGAGNLYVADTGNNAVRLVAPDGTTSTIGGIAQPKGVAVDTTGAVWVTSGFQIYRFLGPTLDVFGAGTSGFGDGSACTALFDNPTGLVFVNGVLYIADTNNHRIRAMQVIGGA